MFLALLLGLALAACGSAPRRSAPEQLPERAAEPRPLAKPPAPRLTAPLGGGYYKDDGPGDRTPDLDAIADAQPRQEALNRYANKPYSVFGRDYLPMTQLGPYKARGIASWYGRKFHGSRTSTGEIYDMYAMSAAHTTLPIPSYVRVSNPANGRSVVVRVNDRGPFHADRLIDLSYTAAAKLGIVGGGSAVVEVESVLPGAVAAAPMGMATRQEAQAADPIEQIALAAARQEVLPLPENRDPRGIYLQLGAFASRDNAEGLKARLGRELDELGEHLLISGERGVYRLSLGPWKDAAEARRVAERLRQTFELPSIVIAH